MLNIEDMNVQDKTVVEAALQRAGRDDIALAILKGSARIDLEKDYLVKICECVFDITRVAVELIAAETIEPPEDDRELFFFIKEAAEDFEAEYVKDDIDDYFERVELYAEKELKERFPKKPKDDELACIIVARMKRKAAPVPPFVCSGDYNWQIWEVRNERELKALCEVLFDKDSTAFDYKPKQYPCLLYTYKDEDGCGTIAGEYSEIVGEFDEYRNSIQKTEAEFGKGGNENA